MKARARVRDIRLQGQAMVARVYLYNAYGSSMCTYKARFVGVPATVITRDTQDIQRVTAPCRYLIRSIMTHNLYVFCQPNSIR